MLLSCSPDQQRNDNWEEGIAMKGFRDGNNRRSGLTLIELMVVVAIIGILAAIGTVTIQAYANKAKVQNACSEIASIQIKVTAFQTLNGLLPDSLSDIDGGNVADPWGNQYRYTNFANTEKTEWRKDRNLHPINTDYDLWSMGRDGKTHKTLTASVSHDDIIRASDGSYVGIAENY